MQLCYVDESGTADTLVSDQPDQQPVIVIAGVALPEADLTAITHEWLDLKRQFYPNARSQQGAGWLDAILQDIKGATLRRGFRTGATRRQRQHAVGLISGTLSMMERHEAKLIGRVWVKRRDVPNDDMRIHSSSLQFICGAFTAGLADERGMVVVDSQTYQHNHRLAHSMFTQRFAKRPKNVGLVDMPVFGHSDNHAGLQIADFLCSAVLAPIACVAYAGCYAWNRHCDSGFLDLREQFGERLQSLTFMWHNPRTAKTGPSVVVHDPIGKRGTGLLWGPNQVSTTSGGTESATVSSTRPTTGGAATTTTRGQGRPTRKGRRGRRRPQLPPEGPELGGSGGGHFRSSARSTRTKE